MVVGTNELLVAIRNPDSEGVASGGFSLRFDVTTTPVVPEPASVALASFLGLFIVGFAVRNRRR